MSKYFKCTTNKPAVSYKCGEKIIFTVKSKANCLDVPYNFFEWTLKGDDGKDQSGIFKFDNFRPAVFETTLDRPGFVQLTISAKTNDGEDKSFDLLRAAAGAEIEKLEYCDTIPEDFDKYWEDIEKMIADHTPEILFKEELIVGVPEGYKAYDVRISVPCDGRPASGIFTVPEKEGKYPIRMIFRGYGANAPATIECKE
ncbi:MAG: acetylxylan esterase, partial [Ruminococcaceae bacterium]|nr:acetylxylan esterase [Oscillospiraceae bacterium]